MYSFMFMAEFEYLATCTSGLQASYCYSRKKTLQAGIAIVLRRMKTLDNTFMHTGPGPQN